MMELIEEDGEIFVRPENGFVCGSMVKKKG